VVHFAGGLRVCQFFDMVDANFSLHDHRVVEMQHLHSDTAHQEREGLAILPLYHDDWFGSDEPGTYYRTSHAV
jgi:hypothetical protein